MSFPININGTIINFPSDGDSPDWAPAIIQFANAVSTVLSGLASPYDVAPQSLALDAFNVVSNQNIPALNFATSVTRAAFIRYTVYRSTNSGANSLYEAGSMIVVYNVNNATGYKWELTQNYAGGAQITFNITDAGQIQFTTTSLAGTGHTGFLRVAAQVFPND